MPIPLEQLQQLREDLKAHEERADELRRHIADMQAEAEVHETIVRLGRDERVMNALGELHDRPEQGKGIANDPHGYFRQKGVELPPGTTLRVPKAERESLAVEADLQHGPFKFRLAWERGRGFSSSLDEREARR
jgi:hypothetical protein